MTTIGERYLHVRDRIASAAARSGRSPDDVTIVAAAKTFAPAEIESAIAAGVRDVGENYVQEAGAKRARIAAPGVRWHLIGRLQRNKARQAPVLFDCIHSLDSTALAEALDRAAGSTGRRVRCLVEVNLGGEGTKGGISPDRLRELLESAGRLPGVAVDGLMAIPPAGGSAEDSRPFFVRLRELRDDLARLRLPGVHLKELSMGMSGDFEIAVEEGATMVRIGTAIFGPRRRRG
ncbi:MAG: YggS family pyridoxal phosphate-dependent enzyme [Candidatus Binatia bacterium]